MLILHIISLLSEIFRNLILLLNYIGAAGFSVVCDARGSHFHKACRTICDQDQDFRFMIICLDCLIALKKGPVIV